MTVAGGQGHTDVIGRQFGFGRGPGEARIAARVDDHKRCFLGDRVGAQAMIAPALARPIVSGIGGGVDKRKSDLLGLGDQGQAGAFAVQHLTGHAHDTFQRF